MHSIKIARVLLLLLSVALHAQVRIPGPGGAATAATVCTPYTGYLHCRKLTIDHTQVPSTQTNFPLTLSGGFTLGSSRLQNASGFDAVFNSDAGATTLIPWEVESVNQSTGAMVVHVLVASLSSSADTSIYVSYDNSGISTAQNTGANGPTHVYDSNYKRIHHLADNAGTTAVVDSTTTANGVSSVNTSTLTTTGELNGGFNLSNAGYNSGTKWFSASSITFSGATAPWTISAWFKTTTGSGIITGFRNSTNASPLIEIELGGGGTFDGKVYFSVRDDSSVGYTQINSTGTFNDGNWHYAVGTRDSSKNLILYVDGTSVATGTDSMGTSMTFDSDADFGSDQRNGTYIVGSMDEARVSFTNRSANWITTETNNQKPSSTFVTVGAEQ